MRAQSIIVRWRPAGEAGCSELPAQESWLARIFWPPESGASRSIEGLQANTKVLSLENGNFALSLALGSSGKELASFGSCSDASGQK